MSANPNKPALRAGRRAAVPLGLAGAGAGVAVVAARVGVKREQVRPDPTTIDELEMPADLGHAWVRTDDGAEIYTVEMGSGPPLVLLHGITLSVATWVYQLRELSSSYRVIAVDQRGHGRSTPGSEKLGIDRLSRDLVAVLEDRGVSGAVVVGHSMGGMVSLHTAARYGPAFQRRVKGLALVATSGGPLSRVPGLLWLAELLQPGLRYRFDRFEARGRSVLPPGEIAYWLARTSLGRRPSRRHVALTAKMIADVPPATLSGLLSDVLSFNLGSELGRVEVPSLVAVGTKDRLTPPWMAEMLVDGLARSELRKFDGAGHMLMLERHDEFNDVLDGFARRLARGSVRDDAPKSARR
ncbi:MAG: alpha/beta fold hydrolase [Acidimicrobiales bacterium]